MLLRARVSVVVILALLLAGCNNQEGSSLVASAEATHSRDAAAVEAPGPSGRPTASEAEPESTSYWSPERIAALESAKESSDKRGPSPAEEVGPRSPTVLEQRTETPPRTLTGTMTVHSARFLNGDGDAGREGSLCSGGPGYEDMAGGTAVVVKDARGTIVAVGALESGATFDFGLTGCRLAFSVGDLPTLDFYTVAIGHRGDITYSADQLDADGWRIALSL